MMSMQKTPVVYEVVENTLSAKIVEDLERSLQFWYYIDPGRVTQTVGGQTAENLLGPTPFDIGAPPNTDLSTLGVRSNGT